MVDMNAINAMYIKKTNLDAENNAREKAQWNLSSC
jgi:hypothetical protein